MEAVLELVLSLLLMPFEAIIKNRNSKTSNKVLKLVLFAVSIALIVGLCCLCSYLFRGYWM